jgi:hypothetical protein
VIHYCRIRRSSFFRQIVGSAIGLLQRLKDLHPGIARSYKFIARDLDYAELPHPARDFSYFQIPKDHWRGTHFLVFRRNPEESGFEPKIYRRRIRCAVSRVLRCKASIGRLHPCSKLTCACSSISSTPASRGLLQGFLHSSLE